VNRKWMLVLGASLTIALVLVSVGSGAGSAKNRFIAKLNAQQEVPRPSGSVRRATGTFRAILRRQGRAYKMNWNLTFGGLTGRARSAHIHYGRPGKAGRVAEALCGPCGKGVAGLQLISARLARAMRTGNAYVNIHTRKNKKGEIRGQVKTR
jgi:CHRD domain-containing protein